MNEWDKFIQEYLERGFGSMNKNDFEVLIFSHLLQAKYKGWGNYKISKDLKIPETKVKRLRYEADLKYGSGEEDLKGEFLKAISQTHIRMKKEKGGDIQILFAVESLSLRKYIESLLKEKGRFADSSFNSEIMKLQIDDFVILLETFYTKKELKDFVAEIKKKQGIKEETTFQRIVQSVITGFSEEGGRKLLDLTLEGIKAAKPIILASLI